jgi:hypothetical protein
MFRKTQGYDDVARVAFNGHVRQRRPGVPVERHAGRAQSHRP